MPPRCCGLDFLRLSSAWRATDQQSVTGRVDSPHSVRWREICQWLGPPRLYDTIHLLHEHLWPQFAHFDNFVCWDVQPLRRPRRLASAFGASYRQ